MELPQYLQKLNPQAAIMSDAVPRVDMSGLQNLTREVQGFIKTTQDFRDELNLDKAKKEYEVWLLNEKQNFQMNTTLDNLDTQSSDFNQRATDKIDEVLRANHIPWTKMRKASNKMQLLYVPNNLHFSMQVGEAVKAKAYLTQEQEYDNSLGNMISTATSAQLRGENGHALLHQMLDDADNQVDVSIASGYIPAYMRENLILTKKMQATGYFFGRLLKEDPQAAYDFVTHNSRNVLMDQGKFYKAHAHTGEYQTLYSKNQSEYAGFQDALNALSAYDRQRLGIGNTYVKGELSTNSEQYDLGALYYEALNSGMTLTEAVANPSMLEKYSTPYSPKFTRNSIYYNESTKDFAGFYDGDRYIAASLNPDSKYFDEDLRYLNTKTIYAVQDAYNTYESAGRKSKQAEQKANFAIEEYYKKKDLAADNITGDIPTNVVYANSSVKDDPYTDAPVPPTTMHTDEILQIIEEEAEKAGVPKAAAYAIFKKESNFNPKVRGSSGEYGIGQLMPATAKSLGVKNPWIVRENVRASLKYYAGALKRAKGDPIAAYAGYNGGYNAVDWYLKGTGSAQLRNNVKGFEKIYNKYKG